MSTVKDNTTNPEEGCFTKIVRFVTGRRAGEEVEEDEITEYDKGIVGIGPCKPGCLQFLSNIWAFVLLYGPFAIFSVALMPYIRSQISSVEKHFQISSSKTGTLFSVEEIGYTLVVVPFSHYGKFTNIPRLLAVTGLLMGAMFFTLGFSEMWLPVELPKTGSNDSDNAKYLCNPVGNTTGDVEGGGKEGERSLPWLFYYFAICMCVVGAFKSPRLSLSMFYIDNNVVRKSQAGTIVGFMFAMLIFGYPIAQFLGSFASTTPVDLQETDMDATDPRFIGAWWLGCLIIGGCSMVTALPFFILPKRIIKKRDKVMEVKVDENPKDKDNTFTIKDAVTKDAKDISIKEKPVTTQGLSEPKDILDLPKAALRVFKNPIVACLTLEAIIGRFGITGYFAFEQKYLEQQFNKTPADISFTLGSVQLATTLVGTFMGGFIVSRLRLSRTGMGKFTLFISCFIGLADLAMYFFSCEDQQIVGLTEGTGTNSTEVCNCVEVLPVCGSNGVTYMSPCVAGCTEVDVSHFVNCTEVDDGVGRVRPGQCDNGCVFFIPYMAEYVVAVLVATMGITPRYMCLSRSVSEQDQPITLGLYGALGLLLAGIPAPIVYGELVDSACILWSASGGECKLYSREHLKNILVGCYLGLKWIANLIFVLTVFLMIRDDRKKAKEQQKSNGEGSSGSDSGKDPNSTAKGVPLDTFYQDVMRRASVASIASGENMTFSTRM